MKYLKRPYSQAEDLKAIEEACVKYKWDDIKNTWKLGYVNYYKHRGNPWKVSPSTFSKGISNKHKKLYDSRRSGKVIIGIRDTEVLSCPVCGSGTTGHVDHYLPRKEYPEFSIMRANLVPTCPHCNSGSKGNHVKGTDPERFIHPYFDKWANRPLWHVTFIRPLQAVQFCAKPSDHLTPEKYKVVDFHLRHVLGKQFRSFMRSKWSTLPASLKFDIDPSQRSLQVTRNAIRNERKKAKVTKGRNSWESAFFRGLLKDDEALKYVHRLIWK